MIILYCFLACSQKSKPLEPTPEPVQQQVLPDWIDQVPESGSLIQLIDPGEEPYSELRWVPTLGQETPGKMDITMSINVSEPTPLEQNISLMMDVNTTVTEIKENENFILSQIITDCTFKIDSKEYTETLTPLLGMTTNSEFTSLGGVVDLDYVIPEEVPKEFINLLSEDSLFNQMPNGFPQEKVGKGAKWRTLSLINTQGTVLSQMAITTLEEFDGQKGTMVTTVEQLWVPSKQQQQEGTKTSQPGLEAITELLSEMTSKGTTITSFDLHNPAYTEMTMQMGQTMIMESSNGMRQTMENSISIEAISPIPSP